MFIVSLTSYLYIYIIINNKLLNTIFGKLLTSKNKRFFIKFKTKSR